jgi:hypothetical protein
MSSENDGPYKLLYFASILFQAYAWSDALTDLETPIISCISWFKIAPALNGWQANMCILALGELARFNIAMRCKGKKSIYIIKPSS